VSVYVNNDYVPFSELFFLDNNYDNDFTVCCLTSINYFLVLGKLLNFTHLVIFMRFVFNKYS
jgi:hypothetical protein